MDPPALTEEDVPPTAFDRIKAKFDQNFNRLRDRTSPHLVPRWSSTLVFAIIYFWRVWMLQGWYIVTYALGIYIINLLIGFLSPQLDPEVEGALPTSNADEFKPFMRKLPEFKFWYYLTRAFLIAFFCTFFSIFDIPVFWPILLLYFILLFVSTMRNQIRHMIKYKYVPFSFGKTVYKNKEAAETSS